MLHILVFFYLYTAPLISSLKATSAKQLILTLKAPTESSSLTYQCNISSTEKPVTGKELEYTVENLEPNEHFTIKCTSRSSNEEESCNFSNLTAVLIPSSKWNYLHYLYTYICILLVYTYTALMQYACTLHIYISSENIGKYVRMYIYIRMKIINIDE